jgi:hypothetical protein
LRISGFQDRCIKPLYHPSSFGLKLDRIACRCLCFSVIVVGCQNFGKKYAINGACAPKIAKPSIRQPRISLLPRWAQGQRKAKAPFFTTEAEAKEELKKLSAVEGRSTLGGSEKKAKTHRQFRGHCGFWPQNAQKSLEPFENRLGINFASVQSAPYSPHLRGRRSEKKNPFAL